MPLYLDIELFYCSVLGVSLLILEEEEKINDEDNEKSSSFVLKLL
jgi:hypothetical protein